ncbi:hypothetical protein JRI60_10035 [Archangium violaceum]|uniref:hypothetical protein n=1 Tax=Archangium violaceum TaxID=83451 RepID=UPI00194F583C|nr:hypothetical protein [Archangium violaceum]QRN99329.1 hypothetical protein JRI60_10035 [Archangium violaceum]
MTLLSIPRHLLLALITLVAVLTSGCLGHHYEVSRTELERLVETPPQERGQGVYAVQQFTTAAEPEPAPVWEEPVGAPPPGYSLGLHGHWVPSFYLDYGAPYYEPPPPPQRPSVHDASPVGGMSSAGGTPSSTSSGSSGSGSIGNINDIHVLLVAVIVVGVAAGVGLAATEGARYEGTVAVHPHHPVHLWHEHGGQRIVALDELTREDLNNLDRATLSGNEGAGMWLRESAPLNRKGFSYQFGAGNDHLTLPGRYSQRSLGFHFGLGYYPARKFGLLAHSRLQLGGDDFNAFYNVRLGLEAQWYPISLWRLHLGPFVGGGQSWSASAGLALPDAHGTRPYVSVGGLAEFELTTRLGLTFRWTQDWLPTAGPDTRAFISSWSVGLAVY